MGQTAYYVWLTKQFTNPINISIPSGNFGNAYSAWFGRRNGLPINEIFCASNLNDVLTRFILNGALEPKETIPTIAPSMDIQIPSSLERLIYDLEGDTSSFYEQLQSEKVATLNEDSTKKLQSIFSSKSFDDDMILKEIKEFNDNYDWIIDPHTATVVSESVSFSSNLPVIGVATASPEKFSDVISTAISSFTVNNPKNKEKYIVSESDTVEVENMIKEYF
jgi:threonine synthase